MYLLYKLLLPGVVLLGKSLKLLRFVSERPACEFGAIFARLQCRVLPALKLLSNLLFFSLCPKPMTINDDAFTTISVGKLEGWYYTAKLVVKVSASDAKASLLSQQPWPCMYQELNTVDPR